MMTVDPPSLHMKNSNLTSFDNLASSTTPGDTTQISCGVRRAPARTCGGRRGLGVWGGLS